MILGLKKYQEYILHPESRLLGTYSTERLTSEKEVKCPWGSPETNSADPGHKNGGLFERHGFKYPNGVIHVGMWKFEESEDYEYLVDSNVIGIEAHPDVYKDYSRVTSDLYGFKSFNFAASDVDDDYAILFCNPYRQDTSTICASYLNDNAEYEIKKVKTKTLDTFVEENSIDVKKFNFLNVDAEGAEYKVIKGFSKNLKDIDYIVLETSVNDRFGNNQDLDVINPFLEKHGFEIKEMDGNFLYEGWGDVFFARVK
jgi:FkbM family methyltransferase